MIEIIELENMTTGLQLSDKHATKTQTINQDLILLDDNDKLILITICCRNRDRDEMHHSYSRH